MLQGGQSSVVCGAVVSHFFSAEHTCSASVLRVVCFSVKATQLQPQVVALPEHATMPMVVEHFKCLSVLVLSLFQGSRANVLICQSQRAGLWSYRMSQHADSCRTDQDPLISVGSKFSHRFENADSCSTALGWTYTCIDLDLGSIGP